MSIRLFRWSSCHPRQKMLLRLIRIRLLDDFSSKLARTFVELGNRLFGLFWGPTFDFIRLQESWTLYHSASLKDVNISFSTGVFLSFNIDIAIRSWLKEADLLNWILNRDVNVTGRSKILFSLVYWQITLLDIPTFKLCCKVLLMLFNVTAHSIMMNAFTWIQINNLRFLIVRQIDQLMFKKLLVQTSLRE